MKESCKIDFEDGRYLILHRQEAETVLNRALAGHVESFGFRQMHEEIYPPDMPGDNELDDRLRYHAAIDGIESLVLAQWCAGLDVTTGQYIDSLRTALDAIDNNFS